MIKEKNGLIGEILIIFHNKLQKKSFKKLFIWKVILRKNNMQD
jgi:hypothetical protein